MYIYIYTYVYVKISEQSNNKDNKILMIYNGFGRSSEVCSHGGTTADNVFPVPVSNINMKKWHSIICGHNAQGACFISAIFVDVLSS